MRAAKVPAPRRPMTRQLTTLLALARPYNSLLPLLLLYMGSVIASITHVGVIMVAMGILFLVHAVATIGNDIADKEIDKDNQRDLLLTTAWRPRQLRQLVIIMSFVALVVSVALLPALTTILFVCLLFISWGYNVKPLQLSRRPIWSVVILGVCYGFIPFCIGASLDGNITIIEAAIGCSFAMSRMSLSILKDYKDAHGDALHHKKTFLLVYGRTMVWRLSIALLLGGNTATILFLWLWAGGEGGQVYWLVGGIAMSGWLLYQRLLLRPERSYQWLDQQFHRVLSYESVFYGYIIVWLTMSVR